MTCEELLENVKKTFTGIEPSANIVLYGSRARSDAHLESDWDFLILTDKPVNEERKRIIRYRLYEIEWMTGEVINGIIRSREDWDHPLSKVIPFHKSEEGILVWMSPKQN